MKLDFIVDEKKIKSFLITHVPQELETVFPLINSIENNSRIYVIFFREDLYNYYKKNEKIKEIKNKKKYRSLEIEYDNFYHDLNTDKEELKFSDLELIFKDLKSLFEKKGFIINWKALEKQSLDETINALAMASPFSLEEKQILIEAKNIQVRKNKISEILKTYTYDVFNNNTIQ